MNDCAWRVSRDCLPNRTYFLLKMITDETGCVFCGECAETSWHLFTECQFAVACWHKAELWSVLDEAIYHIESRKDLILRLLGRNDGPHFAVIIWQVWKERISKLWDGCNKSPAKVVRATRTLPAERSELRASCHAPRTPVGCGAWHPLTPGEFKVNLDAAFFNELFQTGVGMLLR